MAHPGTLKLVHDMVQPPPTLMLMCQKRCLQLGELSDRLSDVLVPHVWRNHRKPKGDCKRQVIVEQIGVPRKQMEIRSGQLEAAWQLSGMTPFSL